MKTGHNKQDINSMQYSTQTLDKENSKQPTDKSKGVLMGWHLDALRMFKNGVLESGLLDKLVQFK